MSTTETCGTCEGRKECFTPFASFADGTSGPLTYTCDECRGTGTVPAGRARRRAEGEALRQARLDTGLSLREHCKATGDSPVARSRLERGLPA